MFLVQSLFHQNVSTLVFRQSFLIAIRHYKSNVSIRKSSYLDKFLLKIEGICSKCPYPILHGSASACQVAIYSNYGYI